VIVQVIIRSLGGETIDEVYAFTGISIEPGAFASDIFDKLEGDDEDHFSVVQTYEQAKEAEEHEKQEFERLRSDE
jgi:hypothetical protein